MKVGNWQGRNPLEGRGGHQDVPIWGYMATRRGRATMSTELSRLSELAKADTTTRFLSLAHLLTSAALKAAFEGLRKDASAGVDEVTYREYEQDVWRNIPTLHHRLRSHQYRVQPLRRVYISKENGKERPARPGRIPPAGTGDSRRARRRIGPHRARAAARERHARRPRRHRRPRAGVRRAAAFNRAGARESAAHRQRRDRWCRACIHAGVVARGWSLVRRDSCVEVRRSTDQCRASRWWTQRERQQGTTSRAQHARRCAGRARARAARRL